ncbi:MAG TPA: GNAT family N-acetyltransferase [Anaerolineales bacterium]|nr:GNAT family N-acetyltransferase [Anaerolineales bacterium]
MPPTFQSATPGMAPEASALIYLTMGRMADYLFGADDPQRALVCLERLFREKSNRFSHRYSDAVIDSGEIAGLAVTYSGRTMRSLELPMALRLADVLGLPGFFRFLRRASPLVTAREAESDEYFISNLAVRPELQGRGLGRFMLEQIEARAVRQGFRKLSLTVDVENERAFSLYERTGFQRIETVEIRRLRERLGYAGYHRMVKPLA